MGVETAILAGLSAGANYKTQRDKRKQEKRASQQQQKLLDQQLSDRTKALEAERKQQASLLRARYGATGLNPNSRSVSGILQALNKRTDDEIKSLRNTRSFKTPNLLEDNGYSHAAGLLRNLQNFRG